MNDNFTQKEVIALREECERLRGDLALAMKVPSVAAMHSFLDTEVAKQNVELGKERDTLRQQLAEARDSLECAVFRGDHHSDLLREVLTQRDKLAGLLREAYGFTTADGGLLPERIDAALAEVNR